MSAQIAPVEIKETKSNKGNSIGGHENVKKTFTPELIIALCAPIGSPTHDVAEVLERKITNFNYECTRISLSELIKEHANKVEQKIDESNEYSRLLSLINAGNELRKKTKPSILAQLAIKKIRFEREKGKIKIEEGRYQYPTRRNCNIIVSIKNEEELSLLRSVYGEMLFVIGVFSPLTLREKNLLSKGLSRNEIHHLIEEDLGGKSDDGQTVRKTFPGCDMFLRIDKSTDSHLEERVERFVNLMLGAKVVTPTKSESAMYAAAMASANSACLSRQVGACATDQDGNVLSVGWNDVPAPHGGLYSDIAPENDFRCWNHGNGMCSNDKEKSDLAKEILKALGKIVPLDSQDSALEAIRSSGRLSSLIEFSRAIHAEMHAIINAGQSSGGMIRGGRLYVTTYPCHSCARHIIAAGISEVYFIEPYSKSLAVKLHSDAITEDENDTNKVRILAYDGVAPSRYLSLFRVPPNSRKKDGKMVKFDAATAQPRTNKSMEALEILEGLIAASSDLELLNDRTHSHEQRIDPA